MTDSYWNIVITPQHSPFALHLDEVWRYRELIGLQLKRGFQAAYKQTLLGPLWFVINPLFTVGMYMFIFGGLIQLSTDGLPQALFYLSGTMCWGFFASCFSSAAGTLVANAGLYSKVYLPKMLAPVVAISSSFLFTMVDMGIFVGIYAYYYFFTDAAIAPNWCLLLLPYCFLVMAVLGLGTGLWFSKVVCKYKDVATIIEYAFGMLSFVTPIVYPLSVVTNPVLHTAMLINPMTGILELFKYAFMGTGFHAWWILPYATVVALVCLPLGLWVLHRAEKTFIDTI